MYAYKIRQTRNLLRFLICIGLFAEMANFIAFLNNQGSCHDDIEDDGDGGSEGRIGQHLVQRIVDHCRQLQDQENAVIALAILAIVTLLLLLVVGCQQDRVLGELVEESKGGGGGEDIKDTVKELEKKMAALKVEILEELEVRLDASIASSKVNIPEGRGEVLLKPSSWMPPPSAPASYSSPPGAQGRYPPSYLTLQVVLQLLLQLLPQSVEEARPVLAHLVDPCSRREAHSYLERGGTDGS